VKPKISVIMLTYNRENLVRNAIESVLVQTFKGFEYIIVDNGSSDESGIIADEYAAKDERIKVIHREKGNIGSGRNAGLDAGKGDYIAFVDDDDTIEPDYLEYLYKLITKHNADFSICSISGKPFDGIRVMNTVEALEQLYWRKLYNNQFITKLIKSELFDNIRFSTTAKYDDIEFMTPVMARAKTVVFGGEPKYKINRHDGNNSAWTTNHNLLDEQTLSEYLQVYRMRTAFLIEKFPEKALLWRYFEWSFMISMVEKINRLKLRCERQLNLMLSELRENREEFISCEFIQDFEKEWTNCYIERG